MSEGSEGAGAGPAPLLRVVRGEPTDEELAALVAVVTAKSAAAAAAAAAAEEEPARSQWGNRSRNIRPPIGPGPGSWRASGLPR